MNYDDYKSTTARIAQEEKTLSKLSDLKLAQLTTQNNIELNEFRIEQAKEALKELKALQKKLGPVKDKKLKEISDTLVGRERSYRIRYVGAFKKLMGIEESEGY